MTHPTTITAEPGLPFIDTIREFDAPAAAVFRAHTDPDLYAQWLGPRSISIDSLMLDATPGGRWKYVFRGNGDVPFSFFGVFHTVDLNARLIQTFEFNLAPGQVGVSSTTFEEQAGRTRIAVHEVYPSVAARDMAVASGMEYGVKEGYERLDEILARWNHRHRSHLRVAFRHSRDATTLENGATTVNVKAIGYWATTGFLVFNVLSGALAELAQRTENAEGMQLLGYPPYFMLILGVWKVLGTIAILAPRFPRLKEWAYAGIFFNMTGAAVSHAVTGDATWHVVYTGLLAAVAVASWALRPQSRTLGVLFATSAAAPAASHLQMSGTA